MSGLEVLPLFFLPAAAAFFSWNGNCGVPDHFVDDDANDYVMDKEYASYPIPDIVYTGSTECTESILSLYTIEEAPEISYDWSMNE